MDNSNKIALVSEELAVSKRVVEGDTLKVRVEARTKDQAVELTSAREEVSIETVEIGREVAAIPEIRTEGNVTIIPVVEEEAVIVKRLILKQEIRVTKIRKEETVTDIVQLRSEHAVIERSTPSVPNLVENTDD
jgi:uncharacterized protein (TIGR02271 family)